MAASSIYHACQFGRHVGLPFAVSNSWSKKSFELIHCDLCMSPIVSVLGFKYYLVVLDDFTHYLCTFPLWLKSNTFSTLAHFFAYVSTQFSTFVMSIQCYNGREFDNTVAHAFLSPMALPFACLALILPSKIARPNVWFIPLMTSCVLSSSRSVCLLYTGPKLSMPSLTKSASYQTPSFLNPFSSSLFRNSRIRSSTRLWLSLLT